MIPESKDTQIWDTKGYPDWNLDLDEAKKHGGRDLLFLVKDPKKNNPGVTNTKLLMGYYLESEDPRENHFRSDSTEISESDIVGWKFFDPDQDPRTKNLLEPHEYALLGGLISGLIHNKTIQGSLFTSLHDKLLRIIGINP